MSDHPLRIFSGSAHPALAKEIASLLNVELGMSATTEFPDSEIHVEIDEAVRDQDIFFIQPCPPPVNNYLMELVFFLDAFRRASAHSVSVVIPYFPYARQDRMTRGREAISARVVANLLEMEGANRVIFIDIHNPAIQGFFNIPVDSLTAIPVLGTYFQKPEFREAVIVSPDVGRAGLAGKYAEFLNLPLVVMHKRRNFQEKKVITTHVVGDIVGKRPILIDDVIASGSILDQLDALYDNGAVGKAVFSITHPILVPPAIKKLEKDDRIEKLVVANTVPVPEIYRRKKVEVLSIAPLLAEIINRIHQGTSIPGNPAKNSSF
jgi:ribose-phosphate pyrophosphokinase